MGRCSPNGARPTLLAHQTPQHPPVLTSLRRILLASARVADCRLKPEGVFARTRRFELPGAAPVTSHRSAERVAGVVAQVPTRSWWTTGRSSCIGPGQLALSAAA